MRNPLASPDLLGVTHGASAGVVAVLARVQVQP
ncbi:iron chelate uptake ABC transporter family permease subunit [Nocardiopsis changdeensis]